MGTGRSLLCVLLDLIVQHQHKGTTHASDHVGPGSLEEGLSSLILQDLPPAVHCARVHDVSCGNGDMVVKHNAGECVNCATLTISIFLRTLFYMHE